MSEPQPDRDLPFLKAAYRDLQDPGPGGCPLPDALVALAIGERSPDSARVADHVLVCRRCTDDLQLLLRTHAEASAAGLASRSTVRPWLFAAAAAALALVLGGVLLVRLPVAGSRRDTNVERGSGRQDGVLVTPRAGAVLDRAPEEFGWPLESGSGRYRIKLFDRSGETLWQSEETPVNRVRLPASVRDRLRSGESYFWTVDAGPASDSKRMGPFPFTLR